MKFKILALSVVLLSTSFLNTVKADDEDTGFEISAGVGEYFYDDGRLDDAAMGILSIGYHFDKNWQAEILWGDPDTTFKPTNGNIDTDWGVIRALYHFNHSEYFTLYVSAGMGSTDVYEGKDEFLVGLGLKMKVTENLFWRLEGNYHADEGDMSLLALLGYRFGDNSPAPIKPKDSDGDGVMDNVDSCPNSLAGAKVDETGCEIKVDLDSDMDGVFDHLDKCPNTPAKALVDANGCQKELLKEVSVDLQINFASDKSDVAVQYHSEIARVADFMSQYAGTSVVIEGHTDSRGKAAHNQGLSSRRADAVASVLTGELGIDSSRVEATGYGEDKPIADNETAEGRSANRRVVAVIKQKVKEKQWK